MTILSVETKADIRRLHDIWLARLAFEYRCEQSDVLAAIEPHGVNATAAQAGSAAPGESPIHAGRVAAESPATVSADEPILRFSWPRSYPATLVT